MDEKVTLDTLEDDYWSLRTRVKGINNWIENNLATDPNFYEMVDCFMEFCKLTNGYNEYYTREGYPMLEENGQSRQTNSYDIFKLNPGLYDIRSELIDMYNLRKDSPFFQEELPNKVLEELDRRAYMADFGVSDMGDNAKAVAQASGVYFYIWQQKQTDADFIYNNDAEFEGINRSLEEMKENGVYYMDNLVDSMVSDIKKNSVFNEEEYMDSMTM